LEHTGDLLSQFEEGNTAVNHSQTATTSPHEEDIIHSDLISDPIMDDPHIPHEDSDEDTNEADENIEDTFQDEPNTGDSVPQIIDDGLETNVRRSNRSRNPPKIFDF